MVGGWTRQRTLVRMSTTPAEVIIGLDVGTTAVKAAAFAPDGSWRHVSEREHPLHRSGPDQYVQDPAAVLAAARGALADCVTHTRAAEVLAVSVTTGMHGLAALDGHRRPLTPVLTWADGRARDEARKLQESGDAVELHRRSGVPVHPMSPLTKLRWFARHDASVWEAARWWVGLKELVLLWLTGELVTELSSASGTGLLDLDSRAWSDATLGLCGLTADRLPEVLATTATLPLDTTAATETGLPAGTPVVTGAGDGPCGNLGTGALGPGVAALSLGTSGAVRVVVDAPRVHERLFCYALTDSSWVVGGATSNGGSALRWAGAAILGGDDVDGEIDEVAVTAPAGSDGVVFLPFLLPERAPRWDPDLTGAFLGLRHEHTRAHLLRAAVEGVCGQLRLVADSVAAAEPVREVRATGGVFRSPLWRSVMAATIGRPMQVVGDTDGTALGAAALGLVALGRAADPAQAAEQLGAGSGAEACDVDPATARTYEDLVERLRLMT